jgi:hypothetical protein
MRAEWALVKIRLRVVIVIEHLHLLFSPKVPGASANPASPKFLNMKNKQIN